MSVGEGFIYIGSDTLFTLTVVDAIDDSVVSGATVGAQLRDESGSAVGGSLTGVERGSTGVYDITLPDTTTLTQGARYVLEATVTSAGAVVWAGNITREARVIEL